MGEVESTYAVDREEQTAVIRTARSLSIVGVIVIAGLSVYVIIQGRSYVQSIVREEVREALHEFENEQGKLAVSPMTRSEIRTEVRDLVAEEVTEGNISADSGYRPAFWGLLAAVVVILVLVFILGAVLF